MQYMKITIISFLIIMTNSLFINDINASSSSISVTTSKSQVVVDGNVNVTVTVSSASPLGAWEFNLQYDTSMFRLTSSSSLQHVVDYASNSSKKSASYTYTFRALKSGSGKFSISGASVVGWDEKIMSVSAGNKTVSVITQSQLDASYSKNNFLSKLEIDGSSLTPKFDKNTLEYSVELENDVKSIVINATKEDSKAKVIGAGSVNVSEGANKIEVKVTAENGNVRTYIINATVRELSPINVKIDGKDYTVVRKKEELEIPLGYVEENVTIQNEEVVAYKNEITKFLLVLLKDIDGNINMYIYDKNKETFQLYEELTFNRIILYLEDLEGNIPKGYKKVSIKINDVNVVAYKLDTGSKYALIYGMNVETGKKNLYMYDLEENTLQRYNDEEVQNYKKELSNYLIIVITLTTIIVITLILIVTLINKIKKIEKKNKVVESTFKINDVEKNGN